MINETYFSVTVTKIVKGIKEQKSFEKLYDDKHPRTLANPEASQYGYVDSIKPYEDKIVLLEQKVDNIDIERVLKSINKGL